MSNIQPYLDNIMNAVYGEEVRGSIHDAIKEIDSVASTAQNSATANASTAAQKASEAKASELAAKASEEAAAQSEANAKTYMENAAAIAGAGIATQDTAGFMKGGDNYVDEAGTLTLTRTTTDRTLLHSHAGGLRIESVAGESVQESTTGAQLLNMSGAKGGTANGITVTVNANGSYHISGTAETAETNVWFRGSYGATTALFTLPAGTYTNSGVCMFNGVTPVGGIYDQTFTLAEDTIVTGLRCKQLEAGKTYNETVYPMLNAGTTALPWEPYTGVTPSPNPSYPQEIESSVVSEIKVVGKNLLKLPDSGRTVGGVTYTINSDGTITTTGTPTAHGAQRFGTINAKAKETYIFSGCPAGGSNETYRVDLRYADGNLVNSAKISFGDEVEITAERDEVWHFAIRFAEGCNTNNLVFKPMIREASAKDATFEPYQSKTIHLSTPITLHGIGEAKDRIVKQDGVWGVERKIAEVMLDGSDDEGWILNYTDTEGVRRIETKAISTTVKPNNSVEKKPIMLCSSYMITTPGGTYNKKQGITISNASIIVYDNVFNTSDKTLWTAHLASNPITVHYELAPPTFTPLPEADQIALHSLVTYDTVTYLSTDSEIEPVVTTTYGTSKVGAEGIWNANRVVVLEREKEASEAALNAEIETLQSGHNVLTYSAFEQIPGYTSDMTLTQIINIMPNNSMLQLGAYMGTYSKLGLPSTISGAMGILTIRKTEQYPTQYFHDYETGDYYMGCYGTNWRLLSTTAVATAETTE